jgi:hypothetical protein
VQLQLSFLEEKIDASAMAVWSTLDEEQRAEAVATLARVIAKLVAAEHTTVAADDEESNDE